MRIKGRQTARSDGGHGHEHLRPAPQPRQGPGQQVVEGGGEVCLNTRVSALLHDGNQIVGIRTVNAASGETQEHHGDYFISTMPVKELVAAMEPPLPNEINTIAEQLPYRDFLTVGLLVSRMKANIQSRSAQSNNMPPDNWIYIQEKDVRIGRLQIFNNWSPFLVADPDKIWLGLEYFCQEGDDLWTMSDEQMIRFAAEELQKINMIDTADVLDATVIRVPKAYPAYFGAYQQFPRLREYLDGFANLFLIGRNGMHRYNNQDHSMLTARLAVECIHTGHTDKSDIWYVNIDDDYHEEKKG